MKMLIWQWDMVRLLFPKIIDKTNISARYKWMIFTGHVESYFEDRRHDCTNEFKAKWAKKDACEDFRFGKRFISK